MKSIVDTLSVINGAVTRFKEKTSQSAQIALIGGYAALYYGAERTTFDIDVFFFAQDKNPGRSFSSFLKKHLPPRFQLKFMEASKDRTDPFQHDLIILEDKDEEYPRIDILIVKYKWELEGLEQAKPSEKLAFPVMPAPHLVAMKLVAGGRKDELDIIDVLKGMNEEDLIKTKELAKKVHRDKNFAALFRESKQ